MSKIQVSNINKKVNICVPFYVLWCNNTSIIICGKFIWAEVTSITRIAKEFIVMFIQCARAQPNMTANTSNAIFMIWFSVRSHYLEFIGAYQNYHIGLLYRLMSLFIVKFGFNITYSFGWKHACFACRALWTLDWCERHFADFGTLYRVET